MKTIERDVFGSFLSSFVLAFLVLSFVLTIGLLVQIVGFIMDGVPMSLVGEFCLVSLPETLQWSMPLSLLVSSVLVFSRLSADSEISAMRACGINILSVMKWPVLFGALCTLLGFWVNNEIVPRGHEVRRTLKAKVSVKTGLSVLEPGRIIDDFPKVKMYFGRKSGNWVYDLAVLDYSNPKVDRLITADKALVRQNGADIDFELYHMTVDPVDEKRMTMARANRFVYSMKNVIKDSEYTKRVKDYRFFETLERIRGMADFAAKVKGGGKMDQKRRDMVMRELSCHRVELNKRFVFAMASICFVLIGAPLGIRSQRRESTVGMAISLAVSLGYYVIVILMLSCEEMYGIHPECLIWLPVAVCLALAARLIRRHL
ncbi:MAG: LptF/LptG family permease [Kiritimatiellae bacterium]|nr:LptF/LptG family permease [Kiritimatiellia bacterium]